MTEIVVLVFAIILAILGFCFGIYALWHFGHRAKLDEQWRSMIYQQLEYIRSQNEDRAGQTQVALGDIKSSSAESALMLLDTLSDKFHMLSSSLSSSQNNAHKILQQSLKNIDDGFKSVGEKVASLEHLGDMRASIDAFSKIFSSQKLRGQFGEFELDRVLSVGFGGAGRFYELQHRLENGRIADCVLRLSENEMVCIDAKFPLENYRRMVDASDESEIQKAAKDFEKDVKKHIADISSKYILPPSTLEYAIMFVPAQAVFLNICENDGLLEYALDRGVFIASSTTLLALTYSLKLLARDANLAKHAKELKLELAALSKDFSEYESSRQSLSKALKKVLGEVLALESKAQIILSRFQNIQNKQDDGA